MPSVNVGNLGSQSPPSNPVKPKHLIGENKKVEHTLSNEDQLLSYFVTNLDQSVYGFKHLPQAVMGAIFAAYSRSPLTAREILVQKFLGNEEFQRLSSELHQLASGKAKETVLVDPKKAEAFYERVLVQYGDDSVAELGVTHLAIENISNIVTKLIEDRRIGLNPLEKSSRYVQFNDKDASGQYKYYRPDAIMKSSHASLYTETMDALFDLYTELIEPLKQHLSARFPRKEGQSDTAYNAALRAQACDVLRYLLPMGTITNMGVVGNGRAFEYLIQCLSASPFEEAQVVAKQILKELEEVLPAFVKRIETERGQESIQYLRDRHEYETKISKATSNQNYDQRVRLIRFDHDGETRVAAAMQFDSGSEPLDVITHRLSCETKDTARMIIRDSYKSRRHRTHKPSRAFEHTHYTFDIVCDIGAFRDLHRHRVLTQQRQSYTTDLGFFTPLDINAIGAEKKYRVLMEKAQSTFKKLQKKFPNEAQYVVPFGYFIRFTMQMNAREAFHLCELRSGVQGHWSYRFIAQEMARAIAKVHPSIGDGMMIDWSEAGEMARLKAEQRQEEKLKKLGLERDY